ncbi:Mediator of RNA polymerase II transcription subunit 23 [Bulinus truncatus]|nr:Mediator of RNA polymerase II transcription subunit 23 [Bulinus truncatus]
MSSVWCEDILNVIMQKTPISWSSNTLACFPQSLAEYFQKNTINNKDNKNQLRTNVENEYKKWKTMGGNESSIIAHFSMQSNPPLFLCIIWKNIQDENRVPATAYKVLDKLGPRALATHLRTLADYLVYEIASSPALQNSSKCIEALTDMIWKYNIIPIDRIVLCLALRTLEGKEAQVQFVVIQFLLTLKPDFKARIHDFIKENTSEHWSQSNWHDIHMNFHKKYPEKFYNEGTQDLNNPLQHQYLPVYFGNVCLRFIPVLDILIHRFLDMVVMQKALESILDQIGGLYKFHDHPITYLYNTLFYYEKRLADKHILKRKLVNAIIGAFNDIRPENWCLSDDYLMYLKKSQEESGWTPDHEYYIKLISRLRSTILGELPPPYPSADWRFNEFPNAAAHALHSICVELMALPVPAQTVGEALIDVSLKPSSLLPAQKDMMSWYNAAGLILTALPESYWSVLNDRILKAITSPMLEIPAAHHSPFKILNVSLSHLQNAEHQCSTILELCHGVWHHAGIGQLSHLPQFVKEKLKPIIKHENQFIFLCHLIGPFLQRFHMERTRCLLELTVELYDILLNVDTKSEHLYNMDAICDYLYHIKYMFVGDGVRNEVEKVICKLRPALKLRLRFISHLNIDETTTVVPPTTTASSSSGPSDVSDVADVPEVADVSDVADVPKVADVSDVADVPEVADVSDVAVVSEVADVPAWLMFLTKLIVRELRAYVTEREKEEIEKEKKEREDRREEMTMRKLRAEMTKAQLESEILGEENKKLRDENKFLKFKIEALEANMDHYASSKASVEGLPHRVIALENMFKKIAEKLELNNVVATSQAKVEESLRVIVNKTDSVKPLVKMDNFKSDSIQGKEMESSIEQTTYNSHLVNRPERRPTVPGRGDKRLCPSDLKGVAFNKRGTDNNDYQRPRIIVLRKKRVPACQETCHCHLPRQIYNKRRCNCENVYDSQRLACVEPYFRRQYSGEYLTIGSHLGFNERWYLYNRQRKTKYGFNRERDMNSNWREHCAT